MGQEARYINVDENSFRTEVLESEKPVLVDFWATWCPPCKMIAPIIEEIAHEFEDTAKVAKLDVDQVPGVAGSFGIQSIPTLLFFQNGEVVDRVVGAVPKGVITEKLNSLMATT